MASHKSAIKQVSKDRRRRARNRARRSELRTTLKTVRSAVSSGDAGAAGADLKRAVSLLDRNASKKVIHPNAAARLKSRLTRQAARAAAKTRSKS